MFKKRSLVIFLAPAVFLNAITSQWTGMNSPAWNVAGNWTNNVPQNTGDVANLNNPSAMNTNITLGAAITLTQLALDLGAGYTIAPGMGGSFTFNGTNPSIQVTAANGNGSYIISAPIQVGAALNIQQGSTGNLTFSGLLSGASNITVNGNTLVLTQNNSGYSGEFMIDTGTVSVSADHNLGAASNINIGNGTLSYSGLDTNSRNFTLSGAANINVTGANVVTLDGILSGAGSLTKGDTGTLVLNAANNYQTGTNISGGVLSVASDANLGKVSGALNISNAQLTLTSNFSTARSGSFSGSAVIDSATPATFSGNFSGAGSLTVQGGGPFTLLGVNSYSGGTFIAANTQLIGNTNSLQRNIALNAATSQTAFSQDFDGSYSGVLTGPAMSQLAKEGSGKVTITGNSPGFMGDTSINQGALIVNGAIASSNVFVFSPGILSGSGTVGPTVVNSGWIAPGYGTATNNLTINGNLTYAPSGQTSILIDPLGSDKISVLGMAMIQGPLEINPLPGFYGLSAEEYTILTSTSLMGTFNPVNITNPAFAPIVGYDATSAFLTVAIIAPFGAFPFSNFNTAAVGKNIDAIYAAGQLSQDLFNIFNSFKGLSNALINHALDQMHPAPYSALTEMQYEMNGQLISLFHRLPHLPCSCNNSSRLWIEGIGNTLTLKNHGIQLGSQTNSGGIAFGFDERVNEYLILGIGGAWTDNHLEWQEQRGKGTATGLYGGIYLDSQFGSFYLGGACLVGMDFYKTDRHLKFTTINRRANASFEALDIMSQIAMAYLFGSPQAYFYPYANIDYLYLHTYKFSEGGAGGLNLNVSARTDATLRSELGLGIQFQDVNAAETVCLSPHISLGWVNVCPIERPNLESRFEGASIPYYVMGWDENWNLLNVNFEISIAYRCFSTLLGYNAEISPDSHTTLFNQHGNLRFDWKW